MSQNTEENAFRSRDAQEDALTYHLGGLQAENNFRLLARAMIQEAEDRGAAEQRRKDAEGVRGIDPSIVNAALEITDDQKKLPDWVYLNPETGERSLGRWARGIAGVYAPYVRADLVIRPANVAALEARIAELEGERDQFREGYLEMEALRKFYATDDRHLNVVALVRDALASDGDPS